MDSTKLKARGSQELESFLRGHFLGEYHQSPHPFSAAKHQGDPLYKYARKGIIIKRPPVKRIIASLNLMVWDYPRLVFEVTVSSGTYIRVLFEDFAEKLGTRGPWPSSKGRPSGLFT